MYRSTLEGWHGLQLLLRQTLVEHHAHQPVHVFVSQVLHVVLLVVRRGVALLIQVTQHHGLLLVALYVHNHRVVVVHGEVFAGSGILRHGDGRKQLLDFLLHLVHVHVTHHDDGLQVRTVPLVVVVAQVVIGEVVHDVHRTDGQAVLILRTLIDFWHGLLHQSADGLAGPACAPFLMNHATLLVYLLVLQQQVVAPVVQDEQTRVSDTLTLQGHCRDVIYRLVDARIGIQVHAKLHTDGFAPGHDTQLLALSREVLRAVECHVLQEVSQAPLTRLLQDTSHALGNVKVRQSRLLRIVTNVVRHSVLQLTRPHGSILLQRLRPESHHTQQQDTGYYGL